MDITSLAALLTSIGAFLSGLAQLIEATKKRKKDQQKDDESDC